MPISFVGSRLINFAGATNTSTVGFSSTIQQENGTNTSPATGDLVFVAIAVGSSAARGAFATPTGWQTVTTEQYANGSTNDANLVVIYKFMGATPDTQVVVPGSGNSAWGMAITVHVFRGVDPTTPFDVTVQTASGTATYRPDPPQITPVTAGNFIYVVGAGAIATGQAFTNTDLNSLTNNFRTSSSPDTIDAVIGAGFKTGIAANATFNPLAWGGAAAAAGDSWCALTVALRPKPEPVLQPLTGLLQVTEGDGTNAPAGTPSGYTTGSTKSLTNTAGGRFKINATSGQIQVDNHLLIDYEAAASHSITVRETLAGATNSPRDTVMTVAVLNRNAPPATDWSGGVPPIIPSSTGPGTFIGDLNKTVLADAISIAAGGDGASFSVVDGGNGAWTIATSGALTAGTKTINVLDTTNGPVGSGEERTDALVVEVTEAGTPPVVFARSWGFIL